MPFSKIHIYFFIFVLLATGTACKSKNRHTDDPASAVETDPAYKNLNDSIRLFPSDAALYLRRAVRLTQENAHELAYNDFRLAWSLRHGLEIALPFAANLEILGRQDERLRLLESLNQLFPSNAQAGRLLADSYAASGKPLRKSLTAGTSKGYSPGYRSPSKSVFFSGRGYLWTGTRQPVCRTKKSPGFGNL